MKGPGVFLTNNTINGRSKGDEYPGVFLHFVKQVLVPSQGYILRHATLGCQQRSPLSNLPQHFVRAKNLELPRPEPYICTRTLYLMAGVVIVSKGRDNTLGCLSDTNTKNTDLNKRACLDVLLGETPSKEPCGVDCNRL